MQSLFVPWRFNFFETKHLLLIDLNSNGLFFYLAKEVKDLAAIDFTNLHLLQTVSTNQACQCNLLANEQFIGQTLEKNLKAFDLNRYTLVFLVNPECSELEKKTLQGLAPFLSKTAVVDRHFFYNFYLMTKRNFSQVKFLISLFTDCAELSLFDQEKLLTCQTVALRNFPLRSKDFFWNAKAKFAFAQPDCFYLFTHNLATKVESVDLAKYLKLEAIEIENLC